ncbi:MAG: PEP-CTERM sorting domain-containing protein [Verrucomicrobiota bacterium]
MRAFSKYLALIALLLMLGTSGAWAQVQSASGEGTEASEGLSAISAPVDSTFSHPDANGFITWENPDGSVSVRFPADLYAPRSEADLAGWGVTTPMTAGPEAAGYDLALVPEPAAVSLILLLAAGLYLRRRKSPAPADAFDL